MAIARKPSTSLKIKTALRGEEKAFSAPPADLLLQTYFEYEEKQGELWDRILLGFNLLDEHNARVAEKKMSPILTEQDGRYIIYGCQGRQWRKTILSNLPPAEKANLYHLFDTLDRPMVYTEKSRLNSLLLRTISRGHQPRFRFGLPIAHVYKKGTVHEVQLLLRETPKTAEAFYLLAGAIYEGTLPERENHHSSHLATLRFPQSRTDTMGKARILHALSELGVEKKKEDKAKGDELRAQLAALSARQARNNKVSKENFIVNLLIDAATTGYYLALAQLADLVLFDPDYACFRPAAEEIFASQGYPFSKAARHLKLLQKPRQLEKENRRELANENKLPERIARLKLTTATDKTEPVNSKAASYPRHFNPSLSVIREEPGKTSPQKIGAR